MKLIVTGATGFVGGEVVRLALRNPAVKSIIALVRRPVSTPPDAGAGGDASKLQYVILEDWKSPYPDSVKEHIKGADACIWCVSLRPKPWLVPAPRALTSPHLSNCRNVAVTPSKSKSMEFSQVTEICFDYTVNGLTSMAAVANKPFRFVYTSGVTVERDQSKSLAYLSDYRLMRVRDAPLPFFFFFFTQNEPRFSHCVLY
jgi:hypothetical protein